MVEGENVGEGSGKSEDRRPKTGVGLPDDGWSTTEGKNLTAADLPNN